MSKVFIVSASLRKDGNSDILAEEFARGARESENEVEKINIRDIELKFCAGCLACQKNGKCVLNDGIAELIPKISNSDILVFATPIYYYNICGQLKVFLDRLNPLFEQNNKFKNVYLIASAAESDASAMDGAINTVQGFISCFSGVELSGVLFAGGVTNVGEVQNLKIKSEAYKLGKSISTSKQNMAV